MTNLLPHPLAVAALLLIALGGCNRPDGADDASDREAEMHPELNWDQQVSAVRSGQRSSIELTTVPVSAAQWRDLAEGCDSLAEIDIETRDAPQESLSLLSGLPQLQKLRIASAVDDAGLRHVARIESLRILNLPRGRFSDAGLNELTVLPRLELLRFHSPYVTDEGMKQIAEFPALRFLHVIDVPITDEGLVHLYGLNRLESFYLDGGRCTTDGLSRLLQQLPDLHFHYNQLHLPDDPRAHPHDGD